MPYYCLFLIAACFMLASYLIRPGAYPLHSKRCLGTAIAETRYQLIIRRQEQALFCIAILFALAALSLFLADAVFAARITDTTHLTVTILSNGIAVSWLTAVIISISLIAFLLLSFCICVLYIAKQSSCIKELETLATEAAEQENSDEITQKALGILSRIDREMLGGAADYPHIVTSKRQPSAV